MPLPILAVRLRSQFRQLKRASPGNFADDIFRALQTLLFGNHGLWAAMIVFFVVRTITLTMRFGALERALFSAVAPKAASCAGAEM